MRNQNIFTLATTLTLVTASTTVAQALDNDHDQSMNSVDRQEAAQAGRLQFVLYGGAEYQFDAETNGNGDFDVSRLDAGLNFGTQLSPDWKLNGGLRYRRDIYEFDSPNGLAMTDPWNDINTVGFGAIFTYQLETDWRLYTGPVFQWSAEEGADFSDGFTGGGVIGIAHDLTDDFTLGLGVGIVSQIEDDAKFFPAIQLEWEFSDDFKLTSTAASGGRRSGLELVWDCAANWQAGVGATYEFHRFRLDDRGPAPDGVGQEQRLPIHARLTYKKNNTSFNFYLGVVSQGELRLEDDDGRSIADESYDRTEFVALSISHRF